MNAWLACLPFVAALIGWGIARVAITFLFYPIRPVHIFSWRIQGLVGRRKAGFGKMAAEWINKEFFPPGALEHQFAQLADPQIILPEVETHIDHFLKVKLQQKIPVVAMFVGDKTMAMLKEVFMEELVLLFPSIMQTYTNRLTGSLDIQQLILEKLDAIPPAKIISLLKQSARRELVYFQAVGVLIGFLTGVLQVILTIILR